MNEEATREDATKEHRATCQAKLNILLEQRSDLSTAIDDLLTDIQNGDKYMKVYKQMKMYNDNDLNPILYQNKNNTEWQKRILSVQSRYSLRLFMA